MQALVVQCKVVFIFIQTWENFMFLILHPYTIWIINILNPAQHNKIANIPGYSIGIVCWKLVYWLGSIWATVKWSLWTGSVLYSVGIFSWRPIRNLQSMGQYCLLNSTRCFYMCRSVSKSHSLLYPHCSEKRQIESQKRHVPTVIAHKVSMFEIMWVMVPVILMRWKR